MLSIKNKIIALIVAVMIILPSFVFVQVGVSEAQSRTVKLATINFEPYYGLELKNNGFIAEIIREAFERVDYDVEFDFMAWSDAVDSARSGVYDGVFTLWYSREREESFAYSDALPANELVFCKITDDTVVYDKYQDLKKYTIGVVKDYTYPKEFLTANLDFVEYKNDDAMLNGLYSNEIELGIIDRAQAIYITKNKYPEFSNKLNFLDNVVATNQQYVGFSKSVTDYQLKLFDFNSGLKQIISDGTYDLILKKHGYDNFAIDKSVNGAQGEIVKNKTADIEKIFTKNVIKQRAFDISKQIEIYLKSNPNMTIAELQKDEYFREIAIQQIGENGSTSIIDYDTLVSYFSATPAYENSSLHDLRELSPSFWSIAEKIIGGSRDVEGVYSWPNLDGTMTEQYAYVKIISQKTVDKKGLAIVAMMPAEEFKKVENQTVEELLIQTSAKKVAREIDDYLKKNKDKTINDLQNDSVFQQIAVQKVGQTGYTSVADAQSAYFYFHPEKSLINTDIHLLEDKLPDFFSIIEGSMGNRCSESSGYYDWQEADGTVKKKFLYIVCIENATADGKMMAVGATTYIDEAFDEEKVVKINVSKSNEVISESKKALARKSIEKQARDTARQMKDYMKAYPNKTIAELQKDAYFQSLAIQRVGKTGYTVVVDSDTLINYFHIEPERVGFDYHLLKESLPELWRLLEQMIGGKEVDGLYNWKEFDGTIKQKYMFVVPVGVETADGVNISVAATTYLDEYDIVNENIFQRNWRTIVISLLLVIGIILIVILFEKNKAVETHIKSVRKKLIIPIGFVLFILIVVCVAAPMLARRFRLNSEGIEKSRLVMAEFNSLLDIQARSMLAIEALILESDEMKESLKNKNKAELLDSYSEIFEKLKSENSITHFYFHLPDRVNLLRIHKPEKYGDIIDRFTALESERTQKAFWGIELGSLGTFTLRVVSPIYDNGILIGYIELGKEIEDVLVTISKKHDVKLLATINKQYLTQEKWENGLKMLKRDGDWNRDKENVIIFSSINNFPLEIDKLINNKFSQKKTINELKSQSKSWNIVVDSIVDVTQAEIGNLFILRDITELKNDFAQFFVILIVGAIFVFASTLSFIFILLGKVDKAIRFQQKALSRIKKAIDSSSDAVLIVDVNRKHLYQNDKFESLFGYTKREMKKIKLEDIYTLKNDAKKIFVALEQGKVYECEIMMRTKNKNKIPVALRMNIVKGTKGETIGFISVYTDISRRKKAELKLKRKMREVEKINKSMVGRELKMIELKKEIQKLKKNNSSEGV